MARKSTALLFLVLLFLAACDAPRRNPLDPENPESSLVTLEGVVQTLRVPNEPIAGVNVRWRAGEMAAVTDPQGSFHLRPIKVEQGWLRFTHPEYLPDSLHVKWGPEPRLNCSIYLNARPKLLDAASYSVVLNRHPAFKLSQVVFELEIVDPDNDIDSVFVRSGELGTGNLPLAYDVGEKLYQRSLIPPELNITLIGQVVGRPFDIKVKDRFGHWLSAGSCAVKRVIYDEVVYISPADYEEVSATPTLLWQDFEPGFPFRFTVEIFTSEIYPQKVWSASGLDPSLTSVQVETELSPGDYFWVVWCVDDFENRTRSKPATFSVKEIDNG